MPKMKTKSYIKKRISQTASGLIKTGRSGHSHSLRKRAKRANIQGRKVNYLDETKVAQAKLLAPYGVK
jgi:ribosomal protein L35